MTVDVIKDSLRSDFFPNSVFVEWNDLYENKTSSLSNTKSISNTKKTQVSKMPMQCAMCWNTLLELIRQMIKAPTSINNNNNNNRRIKYVACFYAAITIVVHKWMDNNKKKMKMLRNHSIERKIKNCLQNTSCELQWTLLVGSRKAKANKKQHKHRESRSWQLFFLDCAIL